MADLSGISSTDLELHLEFNDNYDDSSVNNRDMTSYAGGEHYASDGAVEGFSAAKFVASQLNFIDTDLTDIGSASLFAGSAEAWTVAAFVRFAGESSGSNGGVVASKWKGELADALAQGSAQFMVHLVRQPGQLDIRLRGAQTLYNVTLDDGEWHMVVVTWDGTDAKVYFDNVLLASPGVGGQSENTLLETWIGAYPRASTADPAGVLNGQIDDFRIYSRAWNSSEVNLYWLYGPGATDGGDSGEIQPEDLELHLKYEQDLIDSSVHLRDQTDNLENGPLTFDFGQEDTYAAKFEADDSQYIGTGVSAFGDCTLLCEAGDAWTVAVWVKKDPAAGGIGTVISMRTAAGLHFNIRPNANAGGELEVHLKGNLNAYAVAAIDDGEWHHIAVTWNGTAAAVYFDGAALASPSVGSASPSTPEDILIGTRDTIGGGTPANFGLFFDGYMDGLRLYSRALDADDVDEISEVVPTKFTTLLELVSINSSGVATVKVTFGEEIDDTTFVAGDITVTNGSASNIQETANPVFTFTVTPAAEGTVTVSIAANKVQTDDGTNNGTSNTLSWGFGDGIISFDRTADDSARTAEILIGPIPISEHAAVKSMIQRVQNVFGRNSDATGTVKFYAGVDAQDSIERAEADVPQFSISLATLISTGGVCIPRIAGHAVTIGIEVTGDHLTFEQATLEMMPMKGRNRGIRYSG